MIKKLFFVTIATISVVCVTAQEKAPKLGIDPINKIIDAMTLEEKLNVLIGVRYNEKKNASMTVGSSSSLVPGAAGQTNEIPRLGIPATVLTDGPAGVRISPIRKSSGQPFYATHFPVETTMSATWNTELVQQVGNAMGNEALHYGADVLLAPGSNIMRNPLNGRNFEYYSEDPYLSGKMATAMVNGIQSNGVGASIKHFAFNNQETNRIYNNVIGPPRTFREIYLKPFEIAVKESQPWTVMTAYNRVNGTMTSERADLLTEILRREWGFKGMVMTDWYGGENVVQQMIAGNDHIEPGRFDQYSDLKKSILNGRLSMDIIDRNVVHILEYIMKTPRFKGYIADNSPNLKAHAEVTRNAALEGMVLMKNNKNTLPLNSKLKKIAVFGNTSYDFIAGGTGSGNVNHAYVVNLTDGLKNAGFIIDKELSNIYEKYLEKEKAERETRKVGTVVESYLPEEVIEEMTLNKSWVSSAVKNNDLAIITIGKLSGEFVDRNRYGDFELSQAEIEMIDIVSRTFHEAGKKVVLIMNVCGPVQTYDWVDKVDAILNCWMPGQEGGNSIADILVGKESPSGRMPMTWPVRYDDVPSKNDFPLNDGKTREQLLKELEGFTSGKNKDKNRKNIDYTEYNEGIYVGYRYYTTKKIPVSYPFGYGMSYTNFKYSNAHAKTDVDGNITVTVDVKNTGKIAGKEVVQVYISAPGKDMDKPERELKGFAKTAKLMPGETEQVTIKIPYINLASFNEKNSQWQVEKGQYKVLIAKNAADMNPITLYVTEAAKVTERVRTSLLREIE